MRLSKFFGLTAVFFSFLALAGCGNEGLTEIGVVVDPTCIIMPLGGAVTQDFCAATTNTVANASVTFNILNGANFGSFTQTGTTTAPGPRVTYKPPAVLPSTCIVAIQAVSNEDPTKVNQVNVLLGDATTCPPPASTPVLNCQNAPVTPQCPPPL